MTKFKTGDHIKKPSVARDAPNHGGIIKNVSDNPYDDSLHYSIGWKFFQLYNLSMGYSLEEIDKEYELDTNPKEYKMKVLEIYDEGYIWQIPLECIADHRASYYVSVDSDAIYQDEFEYLISDDYEAKDWYLNNMNFSDIKEKARLIKTPEPKTQPSYDAEIKIKEIS